MVKRATKDAPRGDAYTAVKMIYDKSPGRSWRRLNGALHDALSAAIGAHLSFLPGDFAAIRNDMNGGYWMGNSYGSACGERYYGLAVKAGHTSACISFEQYASRPAALWSEDVKTPARLCIGSEFAWKGQKLTVSNMFKDHLVGCSYESARYRGSDHVIAVGDFEHLNDGKYHQIEEIHHLDAEAVTVRFSAPVEDPYSRKPARIFKITYEELAAVRKQFEQARRSALKDIAGAVTLEELQKVQSRLAANPVGTYRHFDIEDIRKAAKDRKQTFEVAAERALEEDRQKRYRAQLAASYDSDLECWVNGEPARQWFHDVRLRVRGDGVETSTGQSVSIASVCKALPVVLRRRNSFGPVRNLMVDSFAVVEQNTVGVKVGCTLVPWAEVERLEAMLATAKGTGNSSR